MWKGLFCLSDCLYVLVNVGMFVCLSMCLFFKTVCEYALLSVFLRICSMSVQVFICVSLCIYHLW